MLFVSNTCCNPTDITVKAVFEPVCTFVTKQALLEIHKARFVLSHALPIKIFNGGGGGGGGADKTFN